MTLVYQGVREASSECGQGFHRPPENFKTFSRSMGNGGWCVQPNSIGTGLIRGLANLAPDLMTDLFVPNRIMEADVVSVFQDRALLSLGRGVRVEVTLQAQLQEGQHVKLQVQPRDPSQGEGREPIVLKLMGGAGTPVGSAEVLVQRATQGPEQVGAQNQPGMANLQWLPVPLPGGGQAWAQIHVQEEPARQARSREGKPVHTVRLYWETPLLGPVQVTMDASGASLTTLFTVAQPDSRQEVERMFPDLQARLTAAGFTESRLAARPAPPGEPPEPMRPDDAGMLNRRV